MKIGKLIREKRRQRNLSQEDLAKLIGVTKNNIWAWENDKYQPNGRSIIQIMEKLEISQNDICYKEIERR